MPGKSSRLAASSVSAIVRLYTEGEPIASIAQRPWLRKDGSRCPVWETAVCGVLRRERVYSTGKDYLDPSSVPSVVRLYEQGESLAAIARRPWLRVNGTYASASKTAIRDTLRRAGVYRPDRKQSPGGNQLTPSEQRRLAQMIEDGEDPTGVPFTRANGRRFPMHERSIEEFREALEDAFLDEMLA